MINIILRPIFFIGLLIISVFVTPLLAGPAAILYATRWFAPELIILGFFIDTYFGAASDWPIYTITAFFIVITIQTAKNHLMLK